MGRVDFAGAGSGTSYLGLCWDSSWADLALPLSWEAVHGGSLGCKGIKMLSPGLGILRGRFSQAVPIVEEVELNDRSVMIMFRQIRLNAE
jgi:hypothetical protein